MWRKIESSVVRQQDEGLYRVWYHSGEADVYLDHDRQTGALVSFEIDWEALRGQRPCVQWRRQGGVHTGWVDTGDCLGALHYKRAPVLSWDSGLRGEVLQEARQLVASSAIEEGHRDSILKRLIPV